MTNKKHQHQEEYLKDVTQKVLEHKYLESEKAGHDLGQAAVIDWVKKYAKIHRREFFEKKQMQAEQKLDQLKRDTRIPKDLIELCEEIYDCVDSAKDIADLSDIKLEEK